MTDKIVVLTTCETADEASQIARVLVEKKIAVCVNILPGTKSVYRWKDKIEEASEVLLIIKSRRDLFDAIRTEIAKIHTYELPELIVLPIVDGSETYLAWLDRELI
jgi:periplasmic divalent cation tolerance protein